MTHSPIFATPDITIRPGTMADLPDCVEALCASDLGRAYFADSHHAYVFLAAGVERGVIHVACLGKECLGYIWLSPDGTFCRFPYIRSIAVKEGYRSAALGALSSRMPNQWHSKGRRSCFYW